MLDLGKFLEKFKKIKDPRIEREDISKTISEILNINISSEKLTISNNIILIKEGNIIKTEIYLKKELILNKLKEKFPKLFIKDIR